MIVLAVDDDALIRLAMRGMITRLGHTCLVASDGFEAWQTLQAEKVDVVITDWVMPDMDGNELCRKIRTRSPEAGYVYVVMASGHGQDDDVREGMVAGADDYLTKPVTVARLECTLIAAERVTALHARLALAHDILSDVNQQQADMIAMLGHDARNPLTAIIGYSEASLEGWDTIPDSTRRSLVVKVTNAARRLDSLIEDVLTMAQLDSGTIACRPEVLTVADVIHDWISSSAEPSPVTVTGDLAIQARVDSWQFRQIIANLVGNATKYGSPPFVVRIESADDLARIRVSDQGEGVPAEFVPHLFERFSRAVTGVATHKPGTGFGLYIAQRLAQANDGHITYAPGTERGSCFTVDLPLSGGVHDVNPARPPQP